VPSVRLVLTFAPARGADRLRILDGAVRAAPTGSLRRSPQRRAGVYATSLMSAQSVSARSSWLRELMSSLLNTLRGEVFAGLDGPLAHVLPGGCELALRAMPGQALLEVLAARSQDRGK
jgi:hypothetical protein